MPTIRKRDIEESENELDEIEKTPVEFWEKKQKELVTSVVDYNLKTISDLVATKTIDLEPKYQRRFRWDTKRQSKLIESFLMNVPVPPIFLNEDEYGSYSVIDGKQRLTAIRQFFRGRLTLESLEIFSDINGMTIDDLPQNLSKVLKTRPTVRAIIILRQSDPDVKFEVFQRLNTGGVRLNPQEIRNSTYPGPLNDLILSLSENKKFHKLLGVKTKTKSAIYQEMRDAEFVLRYFTFKDNWQNFTGGMKNHLDMYMYNNQRLSKIRLKKLEDEFLTTLNTLEASFGTYCFRRWIPKTGKWKKQVLASLFDAQMYAVKYFTPEDFEGKREEVIKQQIKLFENSEFEKSISSATNTPSFFRSRIKMTKEMLSSIVE